MSHVLNPNKKSKFKTPREEPPPVVEAPPPPPPPPPPKIVDSSPSKGHKTIHSEIQEKKSSSRSSGKRKELSKKYLR